MEDDKTIIISQPPIRVRIQQGNRWQSELRFTETFRIGRSSTCQIQLTDRAVSKEHAEVKFEAGRWRIRDLQSANGTYMNGRRITNEALPESARIELGRGGAVLWIAVGDTVVEPDPIDGASNVVEKPRSQKEIEEHYLRNKTEKDAGDLTKIIRRSVKRMRHRYQVIISISLVFALGFLSYGVYQYWKTKELIKIAADIFYDMKQMELHLAKLEEMFSERATATQMAEIRAERAKIKEMEEQYDRFVDKIGIYTKGMSEEQRSIFRITRLFGECDATMPDDYVKEVQAYIRRWKSTDRLLAGVRRAEANGYIQKVADAMAAQNLPPQFFYLALQESNFDPKAVGPRTRHGIAKGIWQFVPLTASQYGLRTGPLKEFSRYDPGDERYHFDKATVAAARYLKRIYTTDAQASGLLVMASYNWGEGNVVRMIRQMPQNPKERNFWQLLKQNKTKLPRETYDYVFYIIAAAVIAENPPQFGFNFQNPFPEVTSTAAKKE